MTTLYAIASFLSLMRLALIAGYVVLVLHDCGGWGIPLLGLFILPVSKSPPLTVTVAKP